MPAKSSPAGPGHGTPSWWAPRPSAGAASNCRRRSATARSLRDHRPLVRPTTVPSTARDWNRTLWSKSPTSNARRSRTRKLDKAIELLGGEVNRCPKAISDGENSCEQTSRRANAAADGSHQPQSPPQYFIEETYEAGIIADRAPRSNRCARRASLQDGFVLVRKWRGVAAQRAHRALRTGQPLQPRGAARAQTAAQPSRINAPHESNHTARLHPSCRRRHIKRDAGAGVEIGVARGKNIHDKRRHHRQALITDRDRDGPSRANGSADANRFSDRAGAGPAARPLALPAFLPDATLGVVRAVDSGDLADLGVPRWSWRTLPPYAAAPAPRRSRRWAGCTP